ncbi:MULTISPECIES: hypothetical protein [unclassified Sphingobacterium]|uniref:hypothetical protein n=1 Tax=unclassified Sphingobacterium TaxID=2609468 RepID=UPI0025D5024C|nr:MULTISPECIES: hypothetical protein [unclassified Sphingobacterium]
MFRKWVRKRWKLLMGMEVIDGGGFPFWMIGVGIYLYDNRDSFVAGMKDAVNAIL